MSTDSDSLNLVITADAGSAVSAISAVDARLQALEQSFIASAGAADTSTGALVRTAEAATGLGAAARVVDGNVRVLAMGFGVLGLNADTAAVKVSALTAIIEAAEKSFGPLLLIAGGIAAIGASFSVFKDGAAAAEEMQAQFETLGAAVAVQGGNWSAMSDGVQTWIDQEAMASGFTRSQLVPALNELVTAGFSVANAEKIVAVSEEAAIAKHMELGAVVNLLITAEIGRGVGLEKLDPKLKAIIAAHGTLSQVMQQLHHDYGNQIAQGESVERAYNRMHVELEGVSIAIGEKLMPLMTEFAYEMIGGVKNAQTFGSGVVDSFNSIGEAVQAGTSMLGEFGKALDLLLHGNFAGAAQMAHSALNIGGAHMAKAQALSDKGMHEMFGLQNAGTVGRHVAGAAVNAHKLDTSDLSGLDQRMGTVPKGRSGGSGTTSFTDPTNPPSGYDAITAGQSQLTEQISDMDDKEKILKANISGATTELQKQSLTAVYDAQVTADLAAKKTLLSAAMDQETTLAGSLGRQLTAGSSAANDATYAYKQYGEKLNAAGGGTIAQQNHLAALKTAMDNANGTVTDLNKKIGENTANFQANSKALVDNAAAAITNANAAKALTLEWSTFFDKTSQKMRDDLTTSEMTEKQKAAYFLQAFNEIDQSQQSQKERGQELWTEYTQAVEADIKEVAAAHKKWVDDATKETESFLDDVLIKHQTLRDELKNVYDQMLKNYVDMVAKQAIGSNGGGWLGSLLGGGGPGGSNALGGDARTGSSPTSALYVIPADADGNFLSKMTGNTSGVDPSSPMAALNSGSGTATSGLTGGGGGAAGGIAGVFGALGAVVGASTVGGEVGNLVSGGKSDSATGGIAGGIAGGAAGIAGLAALTGTSLPAMIAGLAAIGPLGWGVIAAGAIGGAVLGGNFLGNHETAAQQPDINDPSWGQDVTNWLGGPTTEGNTTYNPAQQYNTGNGGTSQMGDVANWVKSVSGNLSGLTPDQLSIYNQMLGLMGGNPNSGTSGLGVSEYQGTATFGSGAQMSVAAFENLVTQFNSTVGAGTSGSPIYDVGRSYPDFNLGTLNNTGTSTPPGGGTNTQVGNVTVILQNPTIVGPTGLQTVATAIGQALQRTVGGSTIGSPSVYGGTGPSLQRMNRGLG